MATTKEYIEYFKLDQPNFKYNQEELLEWLNSDLERQVANDQLISANTTEGYTFHKFLHSVKTIQDKFKSLSNKSYREFTLKYWAAFYAIYVCELRKKLFPEEDHRIRCSRGRTDKKEKL